MNLGSCLILVLKGKFSNQIFNNLKPKLNEILRRAQDDKDIIQLKFHRLEILFPEIFFCREDLKRSSDFSSFRCFVFRP